MKIKEFTIFREVQNYAERHGESFEKPKIMQHSQVTWSRLTQHMSLPTQTRNIHHNCKFANEERMTTDREALDCS